MAIKLRTIIKHPAQVVAGAGLAVDKENGVYTFLLDLAALSETSLIADAAATSVLLVTPGSGDATPDVTERMPVDELLALAANFDAELKAIAGLASAADKLPYFTGPGTAALADFTAFGRSLVDDANAGAALTTLGVSAFAQTMLDDANAAAVRTTIGAQASDAELIALAGLSSAADKLPYFTGPGTAALADVTAFARSLLDDASNGDARATLSAASIGTTMTAGAGLTGGGDLSANRTFAVGAGAGIAVNADDVALNINGLTEDTTPDSANDFVASYDASATTHKKVKLATILAAAIASDAEIAALAGLTSAADRLPYFTGSGTAALATFTSFGRLLVDDADASAGRSTLGLGAAATQNTGTSGANVPLLNGANTWSAAQTLSATLNLTSGQIDFPATQIPSANANSLDDYEEGTWTPVLTFATPGNLSVAYTGQAGTYTKIGRLVVLTGNITTSTFTHTTAIGDLQVTGIPFTPGADSPGQGCSWQGITKANYTDVVSNAGGTNSFLNFFGSGSAQNRSNISAADMPTGGTVRLGFVTSYGV